MRNIGIITINDPINYGNRLQNYAMQTFLESMGFCVATIPIIKYEDKYYLRKKPKEYIKTLLRRNKCVAWLVFQIKYRREPFNGKQSEKQKLLEQRKEAFNIFNSLYMKYYPYVIQSEYVPHKLIKKYDYFVVGSDQIWNPNYGFGKHTTYLQFAPKYKRISIAPSFGVEKIPEKFKGLIAQYLKEMRYISVREKSGSEIVEELTGQTCDIIMDPTLLVNPMEWDKIADAAKVLLPKKYVLTYFLGDVSQKRKAFIQHYADQRDLEVVNMNSVDEVDVFAWGPGAFLKAIRGCEYFFTDSFHGCVFSILFHRQFAVFQREDAQESMFGRVETLLSTTGLEKCIVNEDMILQEDITNLEFQNTERILNKKREETILKLRDILK